MYSIASMYLPRTTLLTTYGNMNVLINHAYYIVEQCGHLHRMEAYIRAVLTHAAYDEGKWKDDDWYE